MRRTLRERLAIAIAFVACAAVAAGAAPVKVPSPPPYEYNSKYQRWLRAQAALNESDSRRRMAILMDLLDVLFWRQGPTVVLILGWLAQGWTHEMLLQSYPQLERDDILAVLAFAADKMREESYTLLDSPAA